MPAGVRPAAFELAPEPARDCPTSPESRAAGIPLGPYRLLRRLARKRGAAVWHAAAPDGTDRAVKLVEAGAASAGRVAALERERAALAALSHPGICAALDWVELADRRALVLEYLPGGDLVSLAGGPAEHWLAPLGAVATALAYLHESGFVHRDVKARNVRFDRAGQPKLIDFGSCEPVGSRWRAGGTTAEHRKPGWAGREHGAGDDVYAFAALCYEMLHGHPVGAPGRTSAGTDPGAEALEALVERTLATTPDACAGSLDEFSAVIEWLSVGRRLLRE